MSDNTTNTTNDSKPDTKRRRLLQTLGIGGASLALSNPAAAHPHGPHKNANGNSEISSQDTEDEDDNEGDGEGHGYGEWCQSTGFGHGMRQGHGYRRRFPHSEDDTDWDDWQPGDGRPPWAPDDDDDDDDDDSDEETYDLTVVVADPDGVPVSEVGVEVSGRANHEFETIADTTDENGLAQFDLPSGKYTITIDGETTEYTTPEKTNINVKENDVAVTVTLAEADEDEEDTDTDVDEDEEDTDDTETYDLTVVVADPDGVPVSDVALTVDGTLSESTEQYTEDATTDENGLAQFDLENGTYSLTVDDESTEYTTPDPTEVTIDGADVAVTIDLAEAEEEPEDADAEVDEGDGEDTDTDTDDDGSEDGTDTDNTEGTEEGTDDPEEEPDPTDDSTPDETEQTVANVIEQRINEVVNTYRESQGVPALDVNDDLATVAREHSEVIATEGDFSHYSPNGDGPGERLDDAGLEYERWAENIAWESGDRIHEPEDDAVSIANSVAEGWITSDGHRANILGNYEDVGVGVFIDAEAGDAFVTQLFATLVESPSDDSEDADDGAQSADETTDE